MPRFLRFLAGLAFLATFSLPGTSAQAQEVGVVEMAPYATQDGDGNWSGPAVDLFREAADAAGLYYRLVAAGRQTEIGSMQAVFPVYADPQVADSVRRSLPFHVDPIGLIGAPGASSGPGFIEGLAGLFNLGFLKVVGMLSVLLLVVGTIFWLVEKSGDGDLASRESSIKGIGDGFWWAGVTATTIGYGDLVPKTLGGRAIAMIWMLFSMALTAILTAYLVSLTGQKGSGPSLEDAIADQRVGFVADGAVPESDLKAAQTLTSFASLDQAMDALDADEIDRIAYPYQAAKSAAGSKSVQRFAGTVAMPLFHVGSERLRVEIDRIILSPEWQRRMEDQFSSR
ncbi:potassium channel family protein [Aurantimonas sp. HBX-1]|uniref:potassium channel family protein n=1 Tax=Aurantimonas sp. HBX-1 TaxID=2906072 RepID=UPI001F19CDF8|nr:potassium channel family protein [Aurantimonas sp. HBX-1]UIJ72939.1 potassium channel family protein [Aurantimonas sp. HBX-1]